MSSVELKIKPCLQFAAVAVLLHAGGGSCIAGESNADPNAIPTELNMVINPGKGTANNIRFQTDETAEPVQPKQPALIGVRQSPGQPPALQEGKAATAEGGELPAVEDEKSPVAGGEVKPEIVEDEPVRPCFVEYRPDFTLRAGYRNDNASFNIAGPDNSPNILSELQWDNIESFALGGDFRWSNSSGIYLRGGVDLGVIMSGTVQDSDYLGDNRTMEYSRAYADTSEGSLIDTNIGFGYRFDAPLSANGGRIHFMPLVGYSYHSQDFEMSDGEQVISAYGFDTPLGPFDDLQSRYEQNWKGPWVGFDLELWFNTHHALFGNFAYQWADYEADGEWNLRSDLAQPVSFQHNSSGEGYTVSLYYRYTTDNNWFWTLGAAYHKMSSDDGEKITYTVDDEVYNTVFNEADWDSYSITFGIGYNF